jgi:hypothetical protein
MITGFAEHLRPLLALYLQAVVALYSGCGLYYQSMVPDWKTRNFSDLHVIHHPASYLMVLRLPLSEKMYSGVILIDHSLLF